MEARWCGSSLLLSIVCASFPSSCRGGSGHPYPDIISCASAPQWQSHRLAQAKHAADPWVVGKQAVDDAPAAADDLARQMDQGGCEPLELHPHQRVFLFLMDRLVSARCDREQEPAPGFEVPGQSGADHVGPVAVEIVQRIAHRAHAVLELLDEVLLVAAVVGQQDDLLCRAAAVVGDVEEVAVLFKQLVLAAAATWFKSGPKTSRRIFPLALARTEATRIPWPRTSSSSPSRSRREYALETVMGLICRSSATRRTEGRNSPVPSRPPAICART